MDDRAGTEHRNPSPVTTKIWSVSNRSLFHWVIEASDDWGPFLNTFVLCKTIPAVKSFQY